MTARPSLQAGIIAATLALGVTMIAALGWSDHARRKAQAETHVWRQVDGPPCPILSRTAFVAAGLRAPRQFDYGGTRVGRYDFGVTRFGRFAGHVRCDQFEVGPRTVAVCEFTSPAALSVRTARGEVFFAPGIGQPATVTVDDGRARCVLASRFTLTPN